MSGVFGSDDNERTVIRPAADDRTVIRPAPDDRTVVRPAADDRTVLRPAMDDRTVVRPNPGGRVTPPPGDATAFAPNAGDDDWIAARQREAQQPVSALPQAQDLQFDELAAPNPNPIMRAAGPLLLLLGRLRVAALRASFASLMGQVVEAVKFFEKDIRAAGVPAAQAEVAKYLICATADDIVQNIPTEDRHVWAQYSMLATFFKERVGGVRFFEELDRLLPDPTGNFDLLELQHACMALGFQGVYRSGMGGPPALQARQRNLYEILRRVRPRPLGPFSLHWQGQKLALDRKRFRVPAWVLISAMVLLTFLGFLFLRMNISERAEAVATSIQTLHPDTRIGLQRRIAAPAPKIAPTTTQLTQLQRIRAALAPEIAAGAITVDAEGAWIVIRVGNIVLFESGEAKVLPDFLPVAQRIGQIVEKEVGPLRIVGHTDNVPLNASNRFQSNFLLSVERAKAVEALLRPSLSQPERVAVSGKGPDNPIASNATVEGRARNRRVEVFITKVD